MIVAGLRKETPPLCKRGGFSDKQLVRRSLENPDEFLYLMKRCEKKLLRYIRRISTVRHEEAEDLLQNIFLKTYRNLNAFDQTLKFRNWAFRITHNAALNYVRKKKTPLYYLDSLG